MFENTADPRCVTSEDFARWCEQLASVIQHNLGEPEIWLTEVEVLHQKIKAFCVIAAHRKRERESICTVDISHATGLKAAFGIETANIGRLP